jgi:hypothetical protein
LLQQFTLLLNVKGKPFGQLNQPTFGMSDGNIGVQWNLSVNTKTKEIQLGVNLEGSQKTGKWLIAPFILNKPCVEKLKSKLSNPSDVTIRFSRDSWQGASRLNIKENFIGGREYQLSELNRERWLVMLEEALTCLDETKNYRGRKTSQLVTLESDGRKITRDVSPHLTIWTSLSLEGSIYDNLKTTISKMEAVYNWVKEACQSST